ncbi:MAG TPA: chromate transporter [Burkholderiales bacterium]
MSPLVDLALYFMLLSLISVGGISAVLPEVQRIVIDTKHWVTPEQFIQLYAVGQASPGPNILVVSLIGWKAAGLAGALVALVAMCGPAAALSYWVAGLWDRFKESEWRRAIQRAMVPLVSGLTLSGGFVLATPGGAIDWRLWAIAAASACGMYFTRVNPLWLLAGGGALGAALL